MYPEQCVHVSVDRIGQVDAALKAAIVPVARWICDYKFDHCEIWSAAPRHLVVIAGYNLWE